MYRQVALPSLEGGGELYGALGNKQQQHLQGSSLSLSTNIMSAVSYNIISINSSDQTHPEPRFQTIPRESEESEKTVSRFLLTKHH